MEKTNIEKRIDSFIKETSLNEQELIEIIKLSKKEGVKVKETYLRIVSNLKDFYGNEFTKKLGELQESLKKIN